MWGLDLFSGIGGITKALEGYVRPVAYCENDRYAQAVLLSRMSEGAIPIAPIYDNVQDLHTTAYLDKAVRTWYPVENEQEERMAGKLKKLTAQQAVECVSMYERGMSLGEIAAYFRVTRQAMWDLLRRRTTMRPQQRYGHDNHFHRGTSDNDRAQNLVEKAIKRGTLIPKDRCEKCGKENYRFKDKRRGIQAHHDDYNKPLDVRWLCQPCHHSWHKTNKAVRKEEQQGLATDKPIDIIYGGFP